MITNTHTHTHTLTIYGGLYEGNTRRRERKRMRMNNIEKHCICVRGRLNEMH
jgi:hypothetical protein